MNRALRLIETLAVGPVVSALDVPLVEFANEKLLVRRDYHKGIFVMASPDSGKTTLARTLYRALLRDRQGGLVLCVKRAQIQEFLHLCAVEGRADDCFVINPEDKHCFNPLQGEKRINEAAAFVGELAEVLADKVREGGDNEAFWRAQLDIILKNLFKLCWVAHGELDIVKAAELFDGRANNLAELADPTWRQTSPLAAALAQAKQCSHDAEAKLAVEYFEHAFPAHGDRLQGSLAATVSSVFDALRRPPLRELFSGESTFTMDDLLNCGRICIVGLPVLDGIEGRLANAIMQFSFCRAATRLDRLQDAFLACDECQETVSRELMRKLAVLREYRIGTVLLTQNLAVLDEKIGEKSREAMLGLMATKLFGSQNHAASRQWAADQIGKGHVEVVTKTSGSSGGQSNSSRSVHKVWDYRIPPLKLAQLRQGETICLRGADVWKARWHRDSPGKRGTVAIVD
jgi:type IV secretory pathway TraG/TraD family ATPase VirD4